MTSDPDAYVMLLSGLPRPGPLFVAKRPPLSRLRLDRRLKVLTPEHTAMLAMIEDALSWSRLPIAATDGDVIARGEEALARLDSATLRSIIRSRLDMRTCVAALRRRARGEEAPRKGTVWGFGTLLTRIRRAWTRPAFGLETVYPWLPQAAKLIGRDNALPLERLLLEQAYRDLDRHGGFHIFDFEAVVIYVLKWDILDRWARYDGALATERFEGLVHAGLDAYTHIAFEGET